MLMHRRTVAAAVWLALASVYAATAGPFTPQGIDADDPEISAWMDTVVGFSPTPSGSAPAQSPSALGPADAMAVSLGDLDEPAILSGNSPGRITLGLRHRELMNGPGWDLAVFENAGLFFEPPFVFAELAFVEVSSDGVAFARFPNTSLNVEPGAGTPDTELDTRFTRSFAGLNPTNTDNLAGIHPAGVGTAFDLDDLLEDPLVLAGTVDLNAVRSVRLVDIPGNGSFLDTHGNGILDAWPTAGSGGMDLDAVGLRYIVPEPSTWRLLRTLLPLLVAGHYGAGRLFAGSEVARGRETR